MFVFKNIDISSTVHEQNVVSYTHNLTTSSAGIQQVNIVSGSGGMRNDDGWNETMQRLAAANPNTALADKVGGRTAKQVKTQAAIEKWRKKRSSS